MPTTERLRRRPAVSCALCRKRKVKCDRETPCSACVRTGCTPCIYESYCSMPSRHRQGPNELRPAPHTISSMPTNGQLTRISRNLGASSYSSTSDSLSASPSTGQSSHCELNGGDVRSPRREDERVKNTRGPAQDFVLAEAPRSNIPTAGIPAKSIAPQISHSVDEVHITNHIVYKTRLFGRSHWLNGAAQLQDIFEIVEPYMRKEMTMADSNLRRCKDLARSIKMQRIPPWILAPTDDLPQKDVADQLLHLYLRTIETVYRVIHIPTFRRDYDTLWESDTKPDTAFVIKVKLILAVGATFYDEQFSLRASAIRWVFEAQAWLYAPVFKSRLSIDSLQSSILLLIARETVAVGGELVWISAGSLFRLAVYMGLHRDPVNLPNMSTFTAEMRRRLWNTVLEITLQSSMDSGGPPFLSVSDFDTAPPGNFDDDQILIDGAIVQSEDKFTQTSIAISLRRIFPVRLATAKFLNDISSSSSYEETLHLDTELRAAQKTLNQTLRGYVSSTGRSLSRFETCMVDMIACRYLSSLHIPFFALSLRKPAYAFSRKVVIETALKIWSAMNSFPITTPLALTDKSSGDQNDFLRLAICSPGFFRTFVFQASFVIATELRTQLLENNALNPTPVRVDLLSVLIDAKAFALRCIEAGDTNIKNYLLICVISAQIDELLRGTPKHKVPGVLVEAAKDSVTQCLSILERKSEQCHEGLTPEGDASTYMPLNASGDEMDDWEFMISDAQVDFDNYWQQALQ